MKKFGLILMLAGLALAMWWANLIERWLAWKPMIW